MLGLIYKDIILNKKNLFSIGLSAVFMSVVCILPAVIARFAITELESGGFDAGVMGLFSSMFFLMMFLIAAMLVPNFFETDESKKYAYFIASTPVSVKGQIQSKYLLTLLLYMVLFCHCWFLQIIISSISGIGSAFSPDIFLYMMLFTAAVEFPFLVRFGSKTGGLVKTLIGVVLLLVVFEYLLFGSADLLSDPDKIWEFLLNISESANSSPVMAVLSAIAPYFVFFMYFLSYKISCKLYIKGAETYAK